MTVSLMGATWWYSNQLAEKQHQQLLQQSHKQTQLWETRYKELLAKLKAQPAARKVVASEDTPVPGSTAPAAKPVVDKSAQRQRNQQIYQQHRDTYLQQQATLQSNLSAGKSKLAAAQRQYDDAAYSIQSHTRGAPGIQLSLPDKRKLLNKRQLALQQAQRYVDAVQLELQQVNNKLQELEVAYKRAQASL